MPELSRECRIISVFAARSDGSESSLETAFHHLLAIIQRTQFKTAGGIAAYFGFGSIGRLWLQREGYMSYKSTEYSVGPGIDIVPLGRHLSNCRDLAVAVGRLLLLIAFGYATVYIVRAVLSL
jgi:hypothetical protein